MKKGQITLGSLPIAILTIGLVFLVLATVAYISETYGEAIDTENVAGSKANDTLTTVTETYHSLAADSYEDAQCTISYIVNGSTTGGIIAVGNYTQSNCKLKVAGTVPAYNNTNWYVTYTYKSTVETVASNVTTDLNTEIENNTSIAGIILTIILVSSVLTTLMGIFLITRNRQM